MSKLGSHDPFGHLQHKLWPKEGSRVKLALWLSTTKSQIDPIPLHTSDMQHTIKNSWQGLQLCFRPHPNRRFASKVMGPQSRGSPSARISKLPNGNPKTKCHLNVGLVERHRIYYKGEGDGFPQVWAVVSLVNLSLPVAHLSTKSAPIMH
jgi:hypothetical protein